MTADVRLTLSDEGLLLKCREIELLSKGLYEYFAELYAGNEEAVQLWRKTADEEQGHAEQFTMALMMREGISFKLTVDPEQVESILSQLRTVMEKVRVDPPDLKDALLSCINLEKYLAEFHLVCVAAFEDQGCKNMFNALMASDQGHIESLQAAYVKLGGDQGACERDNSIHTEHA